MKKGLILPIVALAATYFVTKKGGVSGIGATGKRVYLVYICRTVGRETRILYAVPCSSYLAARRFVDSYRRDPDSRPGTFATFTHDNGTELFTINDFR